MKRIVVGISGASGVVYGVRTLEALKSMGNVESHLIVSDWASKILEEETAYTLNGVKALASIVHNYHNMGATIASGSFLHDGMIIAPCSMKTLAAIHSGFHDSLLSRAADVTIKERRKLVLMPRETPLSPLHLRNLYELSMMGVCILPPIPSFYHNPGTINDIVNQSVGRALDLLGLENDYVKRYKG